MIRHFASYEEKRTACGAFYPPIEQDPRRTTEDPMLATCGRCISAINAAAKKGEMIFKK